MPSTEVSLLVPVYNVAPYIERTARSLFEQTEQDIQYVFVDDCSPDNSIDLLRQVLADYPDRAPQVSIISHDRNRGLGAARLTALRHATGTYVLNVDSDDYLEPDAVSTLLQTACETNVDLVSFDCWFEWNDHNRRPISVPEWNDKDQYIDLMLRGDALPGVCFRLIRRELYHSTGLLPVEGINVAEDYVLTPRLTHRATRAVHLHRPLYHYLQSNSTSYTHCPDTQYLDNLRQAFTTLADYFAPYPAHLAALNTGRWRKTIDLLLRITNSAQSNRPSRNPRPLEERGRGGVSEPTSQLTFDNLLTLPEGTPELTCLSFHERTAYRLALLRSHAPLRLYLRAYNRLFQTVQRLKGRR